MAATGKKELEAFSAPYPEKCCPLSNRAKFSWPPSSFYHTAPNEKGPSTLPVPASPQGKGSTIVSSCNSSRRKWRGKIQKSEGLLPFTHHHQLTTLIPRFNGHSCLHRSKTIMWKGLWIVYLWKIQTAYKIIYLLYTVIATKCDPLDSNMGPGMI